MTVRAQIIQFECGCRCARESKDHAWETLSSCPGHTEKRPTRGYMGPTSISAMLDMVDPLDVADAMLRRNAELRRDFLDRPGNAGTGE